MKTTMVLRLREDSVLDRVDAMCEFFKASFVYLLEDFGFDGCNLIMRSYENINMFIFVPMINAYLFSVNLFGEVIVEIGNFIFSEEKS